MEKVVVAKISILEIFILAEMDPITPSLLPMALEVGKLQKAMAVNMVGVLDMGGSFSPGGRNQESHQMNMQNICRFADMQICISAEYSIRIFRILQGKKIY